MRKWTLFLVGVFIYMNFYGQISNDTIDFKYLEDQWYLSMSNNILNNTGSQISQHGFSGGISTGFIKDFPFNSQRNIGIGLGFGYTYDVYIQNLKISRNNGITQFDIASPNATNKFRLHTIDFPFELRWRNSKPNRYKFWRIYPGFKMRYLMATKSKFNEDGISEKTKNIKEFNNWQYGLTLSTGYSTWNLSVYYGLTSLFKDTQLGNEKLNLKELKIGLIIYII